MTDPALVREVLRDVLTEMLPDLVAEAAMPPTPVAAVHRPSTWQKAEPGPASGTEVVSLTNDAELNAFVQQLARRMESPHERRALQTGALRFTLQGGASETRRIGEGAVTERIVRETAASGGSLLLGPRAVLTPLARDLARTLGVTIEKEKRC